MTLRIERLLVAAAGAKKPLVPEAGRLHWQWFSQLSNARPFGMNGPQPISFVEIEAWARLGRVPLRQSDVTTLRRMDDAWLAAAYARIGNKTTPDGVKVLPPVSEHPISAALFDAVF